MSAQTSEKGSRPASSKPGTRGGTRGGSGRPGTARRRDRLDDRIPEGPMEDTVQLHVSYECEVRDVIAHRVFRPETPPADAPAPTGKATKGAPKAPPPPQDWEVNPETGWSSELTFLALDKDPSSKSKPVSTGAAQCLEHFPPGPGAALSIREVPVQVDRDASPSFRSTPSKRAMMATSGDPTVDVARPGGSIVRDRKRPARERTFVFKGKVATEIKVDANLLFALAERDGRHRFTLTLSPVIQTAAGQPGQVPPVGPASYRATDGKVHLDIDLADLLVQETEVSRTLPMSPLAPLPPSFAAVPELLRVTVRVAVRHVEGKGKREGRDAGAAAHGVASQKSGDGGGVTTVGNVPGSPRPLLPVGLAKMFNPMVLRPVLAKDLPDAPATMQQLDELCDKVEVRFRLPFSDRPFVCRGWAEPWTAGDMPGSPNHRTVHFEGCAVALLGDMDPERLRMVARTEVVHLDVFDRVVVVEEPNVVVPPPEHRVVIEGLEEEAEGEEDQVYGRATWALADLTRKTRVWTRVNLVPGTNVRAAAGLDWKTRPGRYLESQSFLKLDVRSAYKVQETTVSATRTPFQRAVFIMDHKDTELLHRVERTIKVLNAITMGLVENPIHDPEPPELPELPPEPEPDKQGGEEEGGKASEGRALGARTATAHRRSQSKQASRPSEAMERYLAVMDERSRLMEEYEELQSMTQLERLQHRYDLTQVSQHTMQVMATRKITEDEAANPELDLLTACQVIDGSTRIIFVEGLAEGWMQQMSYLCECAIAEDASDACKRPRKALWSKLLSFSDRIFASFGIHVEQVKLRAPLSRIVAEAGTFSTGRVRDKCREGMRRLHALTTADFTRQAEDLRLFPTGEMIDMVYKKFGGELTREDVVGWTDAGVSKQRRSMRPSSRRVSRAVEESGEGRRVTGDAGVGGEDSGGTVSFPELRNPYIPPCNLAYEAERAAREERRRGVRWEEVNWERMREAEATRGRAARDLWETWNPQRALMANVMSQSDPYGTARSMMAEHERRAAPDPLPGTLAEGDARMRGWYPHPQPFRWPYPRDPENFREHPKKPSQARIEDLQQPWEEGLLSGQGHTQSETQLQWDENHTPPRPFLTRIKSAETFDAMMGGEFARSVHLTGEGLAKERADARRREREEWERRVVVEDVHFHSVIPSRPTVQDTDRNRPWLVDKPRKLALRAMRPKLEPAPVNSQLAQPWVPGARDILLRKADPGKWKGEGRDFRFQSPPKSAVFNRLATTKARVLDAT